jgi:hypothetical protein
MASMPETNVFSLEKVKALKSVFGQIDARTCWAHLGAPRLQQFWQLKKPGLDLDQQGIRAVAGDIAEF